MVGVIDVGSNTVRLVVAHGDRQILSQREMLHLGADVELHGSIPQEKLAAAARLVGSYADAARAAGAVELAVLITSPGRQAENGNELLDAIRAAAGCPTRILSAAEEARLGFAGALEVAAPPTRRLVAVVDVGGGLGTGRRRDAARRPGVAALDRPRLTAPDQQAARRRPARARGDRAPRAPRRRGYLDEFDPPEPRLALAVGGSARALKRIVGGRLGRDELERALALLAETPAAEIVRRFGDRRRSRRHARRPVRRS